MRRLHVLLWVAGVFFPGTAAAIMDIADRGPTLKAGDFIMRVTNVGAVGNAFFDVGLSNDPSFEMPSYSGAECLNHALLWVGGRMEDGETRVSGGPLLEWRPTLAEDDRVRTRRQGERGTRRRYDDDGDGRSDEEALDGRDEDGDGWVDEDIGLVGDEVLAAEYTDDQPAAIVHSYPGGERHRPLGLTVHQEAYAWSRREYRRLAGLEFRITNHGTQILRDVYVGLWADLDSRLRNERTGSHNDRAERRSASVTIPFGTQVVTGSQMRLASFCSVAPAAELTLVSDDRAGSGLPMVALLPLDHTTDPLARFPAISSFARAPGQTQFRTTLLTAPGERAMGFVPLLDSQRYAALAGRFPSSVPGDRGDYSVLVSCGPFAVLAPGQSVSFTIAIVAGQSRTELLANARAALALHYGTWIDVRPDSLPRDEANGFQSGETGTAGHEVCLEAPEDFTFVADPHCPGKFQQQFPDLYLPEAPTRYYPGSCIWTDADCDLCTPPIPGAESHVRWLDVGATPPHPVLRVTRGDREVRIAWDNLPEVLLAGGAYGSPASRFVGYRVYKLADWRERIGEFPVREAWTMLSAYNAATGDTFRGELPLASITDPDLPESEILYEQKRYPPGRYRIVDREVLNGFHYAYVVTAAYDHAMTLPNGEERRLRIESPVAVEGENVVVPHVTASPRAGDVWVVPNPFRANAGWDRPPIIHDALTRHIDFMGLPRERSTIKIWTLAGDLVAVLDHDGRNGDGQASWDLVTRSGQDVASGAYIFTVDSPVGRQTGRFVVLR